MHFEILRINTLKRAEQRKHGNTNSWFLLI